MQYSNAQILSAVVSYWAQPIATQLLAGKVATLPGLGVVENILKKFCLASPNYSIVGDATKLVGYAGGYIIEPMLNKWLSGISDDAIPSIAHGIIDNAIKSGDIELVEGNITVELEDLKELKRLLALNMPVEEKKKYKVKVE